MFKRRLIILMTLTLLAAVGGTAAYPVAAQDVPSVQLWIVPGALLGGALSPDGQTLALYEIAALHADEVIPDYLPIRLLDLATGEITSLFQHTDYASSIAWTPDGSWLVSSHNNGYILVWDVASQSVVKQIPAATGYSRIAVAPDGQTLAVVLPASDTQIGIWDLETGYMTQLLANRFISYAAWRNFIDEMRMPDRALQPVFAPDGRTLATPTIFENVQLWDLESGDSSLLFSAENTQPMMGISELLYTPDGSQIVAHNLRDAELHVLDVATGADTVSPLETRVLPALSPDGTQLAWYAEGETESAVNIADLTQLDAPTFSLPVPGSGRLTRPQLKTLFFTPDGAQLVVIGFADRDAGETAVYVIDLAGL